MEVTRSPADHPKSGTTMALTSLDDDHGKEMPKVGNLRPPKAAHASHILRVEWKSVVGIRDEAVVWRLRHGCDHWML